MYIPFTAQGLAVCSGFGVTLWNSEPAVEKNLSRCWSIEVIIKGNYSAIDFSPDGRLLILG